MAFSEASKFDNIMKEIENLISWYEEKHIDQSSIKAFLASGESFRYCATKDSIAHMLGIKTDFLSTCGMFNTTKSYNLIKALIENQYRISSKILNNEIKLSDIFSKHIHKKLAIFKSNISISLDNILFICKYNRNKAIEYGGEPRNCDYIIVKETDDGQIQELDIVLSGKIAKPVSSRMYESEIEAKDEFSELLRYQDISILTSIIIDTGYYDDSKKFYLRENDKLSKLQQLENIRLRYNCNIDVVDDCKYYYKKTINGKTVGRNNYDVISQIINCILDGNLITNETLDVSFSELTMQQRNLIDALNDKVIMGNNNPNNNKKYSALEKQVKDLKNAKKTLEEENTKLTKKLEETTIERNELRTKDEKAKELIKTFRISIEKYDNPTE